MRYYLLFASFWVQFCLTAQSVGINATGAAPHPSAMLDVQSTNRGLLIPRLTTAQRQAIASPAAGLMVYDTNLSQLFYFSNSWQPLSTGSGWALGGNTGISAGQFLGTTDNASLRLRTKNRDRLSIDASGNIIVATDQQSLRFATSTGATNVPMMMMFGAGTQNRDRMVIAHSNAFPQWGLEYRDTSDVFFMRSSAGRKFAFDLSTGRMGIGVEVPQFTLDINGQQRFTQTGTIITYPNNGIWFANRANTFNRAFFGMAKPDSTIGIFSQHMNQWAVEFEIMREPRIGIGVRKLASTTSGPTVRAELHVAHTNFGGSNDGVRIQNEGANARYWNLYTSNTTGNFEFFYLGIKRATIDPTSGTYTALSDARLKKSIRTMEQGTLSKIMQLRPTTYQFAPMISDEDGRVVSSDRYFMGFLAQEVEPLFPELVYRGSDNPAQDFLTMDYAGFGVLAIKAIQEQQEQIQRQQQEINELKMLVQQLMYRLDKPLEREN